MVNLVQSSHNCSDCTGLVKQEVARVTVEAIPKYRHSDFISETADSCGQDSSK